MARRLAFAVILLVSLSPLAAEHPNYDIRDDASKSDVIEGYRQKAGKERRDKVKEKKEKIRGAAERVKGEVPGLAIALSAHTGAPEIVGVERGRQKLTGKSHEPREHVARGFLQRNADLYGLTPGEVAKLKKRADYANPSGSLTWVEFQQELHGLPVFGGEVRFAVTTEGEIVQSSGSLVPALEDVEAATPEISAEEAIAIAAESVGVAPDDLARDVEAKLEWFPLDGGIVTLAWSMILWQDDAAYYTFVGAEGGELLWRKNIVYEQSQPATYLVYDGDSPAPLSPSPALPGSGLQGALVPRTSFTVISEGAFNNLGWMTDGTSITTGNNVDAGLDLAAPDGIDLGTRATGTAFRVFDYAYTPPPGNPAPGDAPSLAAFRFGEVVQLFFWSNRYHDLVYELGFTEAAGNFQQDNFGRGGLGNDRVLAEGQDFSATNGANIAVPPDGTSPRMQLMIFNGPDPDRSSGLDQDVVVHELTHGMSVRLHANGGGLNGTQSGGMGEGWSDFFARAILSGPDEDVNGVYPSGGYSTFGINPGFTDNYYYGIRRFPYAVIGSLGPNGRPHNPLTFADIDPAQVDLSDGAYPRGPRGSTNPFELHAIGEVWCSVLLEVRARMINRLGWAAGNRLAMQLVIDGMKLDPPAPTLIQGRNAILAANFGSANASAAIEADIWRGFAARGMGFSARAIAANSSSVVEAFDVPNVIAGTVTIDGDDDCGAIDPGETVVLTIPFTNPYQLNDINDAIVTVGATTISLGPLAPGQTVTRTFTVAVPSTTSCGTRLDLPITVVSSFGTVTRPFALRIGVPTGEVLVGMIGSGNVAVPIADNQTVEVPIAVTESGPIGTVNVSMRLNHTSVGDLVISLVAPDGTVVPLVTRRGGTGDNFGTGPNDCSGTPTFLGDIGGLPIGAGTAPFAGAFAPEATLSVLEGREMNGIWKLRVTDMAADNTGTIGCVQLELTRRFHYCCGVEGVPLIQFDSPPMIVEECSISTNGAVDPGEVVTMNFSLANNGSGPTTNLVATLLDGGGVTALSGPQTYGVLDPIGPAVARPFQLAIDSSIACRGIAVATFALSDDGTDLGTVSFNIRTGTTVANTYTFSNAAPIAIPASGSGAPTGSPASLYPSAIAVSGVAGSVTGIALTIHNFSHNAPFDVDLLLVGPGGQKFIVMSDSGGGFATANRTITFDSAALNSLPFFLNSGTFRPANTGAGDAFPAPAPPPPYQSPATAGSATFPAVFGNIDPNGTWSLYAVDDAANNIGSIAGGWTLTLRTADPLCAAVPAPTLSAVTATPTTLWPPNHDMHEVTVAYDVSDCASCTLNVTSNEPENGLGDGDTAPDVEVLDAHRVRLRAERAATGNGRVYTIRVRCRNGAGVVEKSVDVAVDHNGGEP
jgi:subtilisin-like proprotein convertase family protein